jgi:DNA (cytosine-5)-methyltransferase 1
MEIKILELFGGIGACTKAFKRLGIPHKVVDYVEIDKYAVKSYNAINGTNFEPQDICEWDKDIKVDLIMHGSPCQDFSLAGKQAGGDKDSGTRSSLMYETIRIVEKLKPKYVIWENVKNLLSKKHRHNFDAYLETMEKLGYVNYYQVLNAKDYGIPQNRERVFTISILDGKEFEFPNGSSCDNEIKVIGNYMPSGHEAGRIVDEDGISPTIKENHGTVTAVLQRFEFPPKQELKLKLKDLLEDEVDEKYYLSKQAIYGRLTTNYERYNIQNHLVNNWDVHQTIMSRYDGAPSLYIPNEEDFLRIKNATKKGYLESYPGDGVYTNTSTKRGTVQPQSIQTLTTFQDKGVVMNDLRIRKLTPKECWRLMGFDKSDYERAAQVNSNTQLYKQAGNSIVVNVLEAILTNLLLKTNQENSKGQMTIFDYEGNI